MKTALTYIPQAGVKHRAISSKTAAIIACAAVLLAAAFFVPAGVRVAILVFAMPVLLGVG